MTGMGAKLLGAALGVSVFKKSVTLRNTAHWMSVLYAYNTMVYSSKQTLVKFGFSYQSYVFGGPNKWMHLTELINLFGVFRFEVSGVCMGNANFEFVSWISWCIWSLFSLYMHPRDFGASDWGISEAGGGFRFCRGHLFFWTVHRGLSLNNFDPQNHLDPSPIALILRFNLNKYNNDSLKPF